MKTINSFITEGCLHSFNVGELDLQYINRIVSEALSDANKQDPVLFRQGDALVWLQDYDHLRPLLQLINQARMSVLLARRFSWYRINSDKDRVRQCPPVQVVKDLLALPNFEPPVVERIVSVPIFAPDGRVHMEEGYDSETCCILLPRNSETNIPVSDSPDEYEIAWAVEQIDEVFGDFPFVGLARANAIAALLVPFVRAMINGPTPLHLIEKPTPGTGATLLAEAICDICVGSPVGVITESRGEDEFSRKLHSKLRSGPTVIVLDNLRNHLSGASLAAALTCDLFEERLVQRSETLAVPVRCLWLGTANNPSLSSEMARRTIPIRLDAKMSKPSLRGGFRHPNLREWIAENHNLLLWAVLTFVRGWIAAGRPKGARKMGMYENYCEVIGGILGNAQIPGFLDIAEEQANLEEEESDLEPLVHSWRVEYGSTAVGVSELLRLCTDMALSGKTDADRRIVLGKLLRANRDHRFGDVVIVTAGKKHGSNLWRLMTVPEETAGHKDGI